MAFGKDETVLQGQRTFRQASAQFARNSVGKRSGGGGIPYFVDAYEPSVGLLDTIRLIPGDYLQDILIGDENTKAEDVKVKQVIENYIKFTDHYDGTRKCGGICSAGAFANDKNRRDPCRGCDIFWATASRNPQGRLESSRMSRQNKFVFSVFDYSKYHNMPQIDRKTGQTRTNSQTGQAYLQWSKCLGQGCDACRNNMETKVGHATHWPMTWTSFQTLRANDVHIGKSCLSCGQPDCIVSLGWACPACGEGVIDAESSLKQEELLKITDNVYNCKCGNSILLTEYYTCPICTKAGKEARRASIWDVDLKVQMIPGANKNKILQLSGWGTPYVIPEEWKPLMQPLDLVARYAPDPFDRQVEKWGSIPNNDTQRQPVTGGQQAPAAQGPSPTPGPTPMGMGPMPTSPAARPYVNPFGAGGGPTQQ